MTSTEHPNANIATAFTNSVADTVKEAVYLSVGFSVLAAQKLQVRRHELQRYFEGLSPLAFARPMATQIEQRVDAALDDVQSRLPGQAAELLANARTAARKIVEPIAAAI